MLELVVIGISTSNESARADCRVCVGVFRCFALAVISEQTKMIPDEQMVRFIEKIQQHPENHGYEVRILTLNLQRADIWRELLKSC